MNDEPPLRQFLAVTGCADPDVARRYLEMAGEDVDAAIGLYLEVHGEHGETDVGVGGGGAHEVDQAHEEVRMDARAEAPNVAGDNGDDAGDAGEMEGDGVESEPDYGFLADEAEGNSTVSVSDVPSSPEYDHLAWEFDEPFGTAREGAGSGTDCGRAAAAGSAEDAAAGAAGAVEPTEKGTVDGHGCAEAEDDGEEYILGTLMVRVLQAKNVKSHPHTDGGGIGGLLSQHRRHRRQKHAPTVSPASGHLTPSSHHPSLYAQLSFRGQGQRTSMAHEHARGEHHWSRSEQSYFDVTCPSFPLRMGKPLLRHPPPGKAKPAAGAAASMPSVEKEDVSCGKPKNNDPPPPPAEGRKRSPPLLQLALYSKRPGAMRKQGQWDPYLKPGGDLTEKNDDFLVGACSINVLRILSGRTPYFDEWCTLHSGHGAQPNVGDDFAGRVRIVIEYEPTDPPPRPGDACVFANVHPMVDELYPIPLAMVRDAVKHVRSSASMSTLSSTSVSSAPSSYMPTLRSYPKTYRVEEVVGDHVVLSYTTPEEKWRCTFEVHRYLLLCVERHQAVVEKCKERVLDLCDNLSQSPAVDTLKRTVEEVPEEGLLYVGADLMGGGVATLGHWWEVGVEGMVEDVVDGINLDGRYSHLSDDEEEVGEGAVDGQNSLHATLPSQPNTFSASDALQDDRKALPGMPCCPITGTPMVEPVVAADGHTYERHAIARWLQTSDRSPLTGEIMAHSQTAPNYLLLSQFNEPKQEDVGDEHVDIL